MALVLFIILALTEAGFMVFEFTKNDTKKGWSLKRLIVNGIELDDVKINDKVAIILGNEGNGISNEVKAVLNKNIYIPMDDTESLNVSVAGSIIMYKLR